LTANLNKVIASQNATIAATAAAKEATLFARAIALENLYRSLDWVLSYYENMENKNTAPLLDGWLGLCEEEVPKALLQIQRAWYEIEQMDDITDDFGMPRIDGPDYEGT